MFVCHNPTHCRKIASNLNILSRSQVPVNSTWNYFILYLKMIVYPKLNKARNARRYVTVFNCLYLKINTNDVYQRDPARCMLQFSIFPASATKIQKYLLWTWAKKIIYRPTDRPTSFFNGRVTENKQFLKSNIYFQLVSFIKSIFL